MGLGTLQTLGQTFLPRSVRVDLLEIHQEGGQQAGTRSSCRRLQPQLAGRRGGSKIPCGRSGIPWGDQRSLSRSGVPCAEWIPHTESKAGGKMRLLTWLIRSVPWSIPWSVTVCPSCWCLPVLVLPGLWLAGKLQQELEDACRGRGGLLAVVALPQCSSLGLPLRSQAAAQEELFPAWSPRAGTPQSCPRCCPAALPA